MRVEVTYGGKILSWTLLASFGGFIAICRLTVDGNVQRRQKDGTG